MDLKIKDVASMLNVSETTIRRWLSDGKIPAYKIHHQYRFSRSEIEDWVMKHKLKDDSGISPFSLNTSANDLLISGGQKQYSLYRALHKGGVIQDLDATTKDELIQQSSRRIAPCLDADSEVLAEMLLDRERLQPTALGNGIAVPHTRDFLLKGHQDVVSLIFPKSPLDWGALDGNPVFALFFLFASDDAKHLNLLAKIAYLSSHPPALQLLKEKPSRERFLTFVKAWEGNIRGGSGGDSDDEPEE